MINTGKRDIIVSYLAYTLRLVSNIILLPIILSCLSASEFGVWNIFISLGAIVNLVDVGFGAVLTRYSTYAFCGAQSISSTGLPDMGANKETNYRLLFLIQNVAKRIYGKLFLFSILISIVLTVYILVKTLGLFNTAYITSSWLIYALSCCMYIYYMAYNCIIKGMGKIKESNYYYIIQQVIYMTLAFVFLQVGFGLVGLTIANFISILIFRTLNVRFLKRTFENNKDDSNCVIEEKSSEYNLVYNAVKKNTGGIALVTVSNYITNYGMTLICSIFLPLHVIASIGITNQLIGVVGATAGTAFSVYMSKMGEMLMNNEKQKLRKLFTYITLWFILIYILGTLGIIFVGPLALNIIETDTQLLGTLYIIPMVIASFIISNHQRCTNFIMLSNNQPHVKAYLVSSICILLISALFIFFTHDIWGYIIPNLIVQVAYNGWKWPLEVYKKIRYV